jgi:hypothetical protein
MKSNYYSINHYNGSAVFNSNFYYVKPGYVLYNNTHPTRNFFLLVNGLISYSENKLLLTVNDPLLGIVTKESNDNQFYQAMELEMKWHLDLNKHFAFSLGGFVGLNFNEPILFEEEYNGAFKEKESYKPGIGYSNKVYYMISLGLAVKPY